MSLLKPDHVFIDLSYFIIHKYFGIIAWLKLTKQAPLDQAGMFERFKIVFEEALMKIKGKYGFAWSQVILAKDCPRDDIWRNKIFPDYKKARSLPENRKQNFDPAIFKYVVDNVIPELQLKYGGLTVLAVNGAEADDIVAIAHRLLGGPDKKILIITNDNDYIQLLNENTTIINASCLELKSRFDETQLSVFVEWKIIKGDVSDSIPSIAKKVGDKTALKFALDKELLEKKLVSDPLIRDRYEMNKTMISFESIPTDIVSLIEQKMKEVKII